MVGQWVVGIGDGDGDGDGKQRRTLGRRAIDGAGYSGFRLDFKFLSKAPLFELYG